MTQTQITFRIDEQQMTFDDFIAMVEGSLSDKRNVMARFVVGPDGSYLSEAAGRAAVGRLLIGQVKQAIADFLDEFNRVNPPSGAA